MLHELNQLTLSPGTPTDTVYVTLLAIYVLREAYDDYEAEWTLLVKKATQWLQSVGVAKPANIIKKFSLTIVADAESDIDTRLAALMMI